MLRFYMLVLVGIVPGVITNALSLSFAMMFARSPLGSNKYW